MDPSERYVAWTHKGGLQAAWGAGLLAIFLPAGWFASGRALPSSIFWLIPVGGFIGYWIGKAFGFAVLTGAGSAAQAFTMPAAIGHYANEHSEILTLEVRGDFRG